MQKRLTFIDHFHVILLRGDLDLIFPVKILALSQEKTFKFLCSERHLSVSEVESLFATSGMVWTHDLPMKMAVAFGLRNFCNSDNAMTIM